MEKQLAKSTAVVGSMTLLSRILGFLRDVIIAKWFGATDAADAFFVAFKIPNFMRRLLAEGAFSQAFIPVLAEYRKNNDETQERTLIEHVAGTLSLVLVGVTVLSVLAAPILVMIFAPGFISSGGRFELAVDLLRIMFPYLAFVSLVALAGAVLNTRGVFWAPAFTPVFLNISIIVSTVYFSPYFAEPIFALGWGVFLGGVLQLVFQWPFLQKQGMLPRLRFNLDFPGVRRVLQLMVPAILGVSVVQINLLVDTIIASFLQIGSVSWLYYSDRVMEFPLGIFGVALSTVVLPHLSRHHVANAAADFQKSLDWSLRVVFLIAVPAMLGLVVLSQPILTTLFNYGAFTVRDVVMSQKSLIPYAFGMLAFILVKVLAAGFYARQDIRTPVRIAMWAVASNLLFNACFAWWLAHAGLALSTSLAGCVNAAMLFYFLKKKNIFLPSSGWRDFFVRVAIANGLMVLCLWLITPENDAWLHWSAIERALRLSGVIGAGALVYGVSGFVLKLHQKTKGPAGP